MCTTPSFHLPSTVFALFLLMVQTPLVALADDAVSPVEKPTETTVPSQEPTKKPRLLYTTLGGVARFYKSTTKQVRGWFTHGRVSPDVTPGQETTKPYLLPEVDNAREHPPMVQTFFSIGSRADSDMGSQLSKLHGNSSSADLENCQGTRISDGSLSDSTTGLRGLRFLSGISVGMCLKF
jgi:hypothetical protein